MLVFRTLPFRNVSSMIEMPQTNGQLGTQSYPHNYGGRDDGFSNTACKTGDKLIEFPMSVGVYSGEAVTDLPDRVIIKIDGKKGVYCGLVTHIVSHYSREILLKVLQEANSIIA